MIKGHKNINPACIIRRLAAIAEQWRTRGDFEQVGLNIIMTINEVVTEDPYNLCYPLLPFGAHHLL